MDITIEDLKAYTVLKSAVWALEEELQAVYVSSPGPKEVQGGRASVRTPSDPTAAKARRANELRDRIERTKHELEEKQRAIEDFSTAIDDPIVGAIIRWHYIRGLGWTQTCYKVYGYPDPDTCRKAVRRYFRKKEKRQSEND